MAAKGLNEIFGEFAGQPIELQSKTEIAYGRRLGDTDTEYKVYSVDEKDSALVKAMNKAATDNGLKLVLHMPSDSPLYEQPKENEVFAYIERAPGRKWRISRSFDAS